MISFLYIDPGTGSMLFSILIGAAATLFFLFKALILKVKVLISGKKSGIETDSSYKNFVIYSEGKQYWNVFKPILDEAESRQIPMTYFTSYKQDEVFNQNYKFIQSQFIGEGNAAFAKLNLLSAGFVLMTTPGLNVYQLKRSKNVKHYSHIVHMPSDATMYRLFGLDFFDSVLLSGDYQKKDIQTLEKMRGLKPKTLYTVGCTYLDVLKQKISLIPQEENHQFTVLVSPTWGKSSLLCKYGTKLLDPLASSSFKIIIRPHPQSKSAEPKILSSLQEKYKNFSNVEWDFQSDNIYSLKKADIMISDFSGIVYDYMFLCNKPVMYVNADIDLMPYDAYDINGGKEIWQFKMLKELGIELKEEDFPNIIQTIKNASDSKQLEEKRLQAKNEAWMFEGESAKRTVDFMVQTLSSIKGNQNGK